ncbi:MAG: 23S rRNA (guanosine(2251)-2'-O)-methyltransferase RlmB [Candidatus Omnitrophota bacterium]
MRLYGKNSILERLKSAPQTIKAIYIKKGMNLETIATLARQNDIPFNSLPEQKFSNFTQGINCQGVVAEVEKFTYSFLEDFLLRDEKDGLLTIVFLDHITDPQNLGSIIRTLACFGDFGLVLPKDASVSVNETVLKVACGAESFLPVAQIANLSVGLDMVKDKDYWVAAAVPEGGENLLTTKLAFPLAIVIGSEGKGVRRSLLNQVDLKLTLPMPGANISFNAAIATAIFSYEIFRQKNIINPFAFKDKIC